MVHSFFRLSLLLAAIALWFGTCKPAQALDSIAGGALPDALPLFPADNWWNLDIRSWPVDPHSANYIAFINNGGTRRLHPDLGGDASTPQDPYATYGMPYAVASGVITSDLVAVDFLYWDESDGVDLTRARVFPSIRSRPRQRRSLTGSKAAIRATSICATTRTATCS